MTYFHNRDGELFAENVALTTIAELMARPLMFTAVLL
jgi:hypothetical protein